MPGNAPARGFPHMDKLRAAIAKQPKLAAFLLPFLAAVAAFSPTLWFSLVWDDAAVYTQQVPFFNTLASAFRAPTNIPNYNNMFYRPGVVLTYLFDDWLNRLLLGASITDPVPAAPIPHGVTVLAHALVTGLVGLLAYRLFATREKRLFAALAAGCAYAFHAAHLDSVAIASGRSDVLAAIFVVGGALAFLKWRDEANPAYLALSALSVLSGLFCKEVAICALALYPTLWLLADRGETNLKNAAWKRLALSFAALAAAAALYFAIRANLGQLPIKGSIPFSPDAATNVVLALAFYLWKTFLPFPNHLFILEPFLGTGIALALVLAFVAGGALLIHKAKSERAFIALCLLWYFGSLAPSFGPLILKAFRAATAERYLYLPSVAACLAFGALLTRLKAKPAAAFAGVVLGGLLLLTLFALPTYSRDITFWETVASQKCSEKFALVWTSLGDIHLREGRYEKAVEAYTKAGGPEMKTDIIIGRVSANGYAAARAMMAERALSSGDTETAYRYAAEAVDTYQKYPLKSIDEQRWNKNLGKAYYTLYRVKRAIGVDDRSLIALSLRFLSEAIRMRQSDQEALNAYVQVSSAR